MASLVNPDRFVVLQQVVAAISPHVTVRYDRGFRFAWERSGVRVERRWVSQSGSPDYPVWYRERPSGGTWCRAVYQLIRWCRGQTVESLRCWRYWCGPTVKLNPTALDLVTAAGWPELVPCIGCGRVIQPGDGQDWYSRDHTDGPGCLPMCGGLSERKPA
jgi:hypothetical protein